MEMGEKVKETQVRFFLGYPFLPVAMTKPLVSQLEKIPFLFGWWGSFCTRFSTFHFLNPTWNSVQQIPVYSSAGKAGIAQGASRLHLRNYNQCSYLLRCEGLKVCVQQAAKTWICCVSLSSCEVCGWNSVFQLVNRTRAAWIVKQVNFSTNK